MIALPNNMCFVKIAKAGAGCLRGFEFAGSFVQTRGTIGSMRKGGRNVQGYRCGGVYS